MQTTPEQGPPSWTVYFQSPDADATARAAEQAHGAVTVQPMDVQDLGRMAILADKAGVPFGVWQPGRNKGLEVVQEPGSLCWVELYTADVPATAAFYHAVLGLETFGADFAGGTYTTFNPAGESEDAMFGGVVPLADDPGEEEAYWLPYFEVADPDAIVAKAGTGRHGPPPRDGPSVRRPPRQTRRPVRRPLRGDPQRAAAGPERRGGCGGHAEAPPHQRRRHARQGSPRLPPAPRVEAAQEQAGHQAAHLLYVLTDRREGRVGLFRDGRMSSKPITATSSGTRRPARAGRAAPRKR